VQVVADAGLIEDGFTDEFDLESSPYTSTIVFLVRKDNPKNIEDWDDLLREDVGVITPNPKTSGGARWNYLAAWYYFESQGQSGEEITENMKTLYHNVLVLDSGARGATITFAENGQGDVLIAWENEAFLSLEEHPGEYEIVVPSVSILCQPTVALVDEVVDDRGTRDVATEYLQYLYSTEAQKLEAENFLPPVGSGCFFRLISVHRGSASSRNCRQTENGSWMTLHSRILRTLVDGVRRRRSISRTAECLTRFMNSD